MLYVIAYILSLLPFRILFAVSDVLAWLACDVVRYRRSAVRKSRIFFPGEKL